ncbi:hypothetical protein CBR_g20354 [Chara braunii]|uniref:Uncharacterized protein n=1 Tax=Chara braunii TaxID=69332 RepID=A0A388JU29_CHABU|nr:hypothetical protein CBR_g20354 [Chara braunii]|eukprot:GBG61319.1 hypothetical protein CBR_g20354 [Chara braunii]
MNKAVEAAGREKKGRHTVNRKRKVIQGGPSVAGYNEDDEWVGEGVATQEESDFQEEEEVLLKRRFFRRTGEGIQIEEGGYEGGERRGGGGRAVMEDAIDVDAATASREGVAGAIAQQMHTPVPRLNDTPTTHEPAVRARTPTTSRSMTVADVGGTLQAIGQGNRNCCPEQEAHGPATGGNSHAGEGVRAGAILGGASHAGEGARAGAAAGVASHAGEGARAGDVAGVGEDDEALVNKVRQHNTRDGMEAATKHWADDLRFWNETEGNAIVKLIQEASPHLVAVAWGVQCPPVRRSIVLPHTTIPQHKIEDKTELNAAKEKGAEASRQRGYHASYGYELNNAATDIARAIWMGEDWRISVSPMVFHSTLDMDMKLPLWFVATEIEDRHEDNELASYQEASIQRLVGAFTRAVSMAEGVDDWRVSYERLKSIADTMRIMLAATMWFITTRGFLSN